MPDSTATRYFVIAYDLMSLTVFRNQVILMVLIMLGFASNETFSLMLLGGFDISSLLSVRIVHLEFWLLGHVLPLVSVEDVSRVSAKGNFARFAHSPVR